MTRETLFSNLQAADHTREQLAGKNFIGVWWTDLVTSLEDRVFELGDNQHIVVVAGFQEGTMGALSKVRLHREAECTEVVFPISGSGSMKVMSGVDRRSYCQAVSYPLQGPLSRSEFNGARYDLVIDDGKLGLHVTTSTRDLFVPGVVTRVGYWHETTMDPNNPPSYFAFKYRTL